MRKKGEGTVRLRKDGRWEGRVVISYDENGLPKTKNILARSKSECIEKLENLKERCGDVRPSQVSPRMKFRDWLDYWYKNISKPGLRQTTQQFYEQLIYNHLIPSVGDIALNKLKQDDLQRCFNNMKRYGRRAHTEKKGTEMADRSVRSCYAVCKMALDMAVKEHLLRKNPAAGCKLPPRHEKEMKILTWEEIHRFLVQAKEEGMYELFLLELTTGMRRGELLALKWSDLDPVTGKLRIDKQIYPVGGKLVVSEPKTKAANRTIILPPTMVELLLIYQQGIFSEWMFPSRIKPEQPIDPGYVRKRLQVILERAGCKRVRFHDLRHTFSTMSLEQGMDVKTLSTIIGHASSSITLNIYAHVTDEMRQKAAENIDQGIMRTEAIPAAQEDEIQEAEEFTPVQPHRRRPGTGCVTQINDRLWEGRYSPKINGKRVVRNIYAHSEAECERKLAALITEMKAEIAAERGLPSREKQIR